MSATIITRDQVAVQLAISVSQLARYEAAGLLHVIRAGDHEGYSPAEIRRAWTIVSCQRDLGINLAGIEAVLKLRDHLAQLHDQLDLLATRLRQALDEDEAATHEQR